MPTPWPQPLPSITSTGTAACAAGAGATAASRDTPARSRHRMAPSLPHPHPPSANPGPPNSLTDRAVFRTKRSPEPERLGGEPLLAGRCRAPGHGVEGVVAGEDGVKGEARGAADEGDADGNGVQERAARESQRRRPALVLG